MPRPVPSFSGPVGRLGPVGVVRRMLERRPPLADFIHDELVGGVVLLVATAAALIWANMWPSGL